MRYPTFLESAFFSYSQGESLDECPYEFHHFLPIVTTVSSEGLSEISIQPELNHPQYNGVRFFPCFSTPAIPDCYFEEFSDPAMYYLPPANRPEESAPVFRYKR